MPLTRLQSAVLGALASERSPDSFIAGGIADSDGDVLAKAGFRIEWLPGRGPGKRAALVHGLGDTTQLEWVADADFRFFPAQRDDLFGYVLHPADLATNKASAAADRRVPRDIVDLVTVHQRILPLGAVAAAAVGRFPGMTPEEMLSEIRRHSTFTVDEFEALAMERPIDVGETHRRIKTMLSEADAFIRELPSDAVGFLFLDGEKVVQPDVTKLDAYVRHAGARRGQWPTSSQIGTAMLERYSADDAR